jgi:multidrug efflux pump subunit AcrA (membrane-fusion protein)
MKRRYGPRLAVALAVAFVLVGGCALQSGCSFLPAEDPVLSPPLVKPVKVEFKTMSVTRGSVVKKVELTGFYYPKKVRSLSFGSQGGRLAALHVGVGDVVAAGDLLAELESHALQTEIRIQRLEVEKCELVLEGLKLDGARHVDVRLAEIALEEQRIRLSELLEQFAATRIVAPFAGTVVDASTLSEGEAVSSDQTIVRLADPSELLVVAASTIASGIPVGAAVTVVHGQPAVTEDGTVVATPATLSGNADPNLQSSYLFAIAGGLPKDAVMGGTVGIVYVQARRTDVLVIPSNLVNTWNGQTFVYVLEDGLRVERYVVVGLVADLQSEIVEGLAEGDKVIIG